MPKAHINIGSNIGDRHANIGQAVAAIRNRIDPHAFVSQPYYSQPLGFDGSNEFVNVGVMLLTDIDPFALLRKLQEIQAEIDPAPHRDKEGAYIDRAIDIDLITYGDWQISSDFLTIPHPRMHQRPFVLEPIRELESKFSNLIG